jgi:hypothetical protein
LEIPPWSTKCHTSQTHCYLLSHFQTWHWWLQWPKSKASLSTRNPSPEFPLPSSIAEHPPRRKTCKYYSHFSLLLARSAPQAKISKAPSPHTARKRTSTTSSSTLCSGTSLSPAQLQLLPSTHCWGRSPERRDSVSLKSRYRRVDCWVGKCGQGRNFELCWMKLRLWMKGKGITLWERIPWMTGRSGRDFAECRRRSNLRWSWALSGRCSPMDWSRSSCHISGRARGPGNSQINCIGKCYCTPPWTGACPAEAANSLLPLPGHPLFYLFYIIFKMIYSIIKLLGKG